MSGYIKLHRDFLRHWVSSDPAARSLWIEILLSAAYEPKKDFSTGRLLELLPGQLIFRQPQWESRLNIDGSKIYRLLEAFEQDGMIERKAYGRRFSIITVVNWTIYQATGEVCPTEKNEKQNEKQSALEITGLVADSKKQNEQLVKNRRKTIYKEVQELKENIKDISSKVFSDDSLEMILSNLLKSKILDNNPKARVPGNMKKWAEEMDLMIRIDNRSEQEIRQVIELSQKDTFWKPNILSPSKLREKFDTLILQSKRPIKTVLKTSQHMNFEQREYGEEYYNSFFDNTKAVK